jgi:DNA-binding NarL/FixJ family response regulator
MMNPFDAAPDEGRTRSTQKSPGSSGSTKSSSAGLLRNRPDICEHLTDAQLAVVEMLISGQSAPQISKQIGRSVNTVHDHIKAIYKKLRVNNRVQLVLLFTTPVN